MANYLFAFKYMASNEGGLSDNPSDHGGFTFKGLTLKLASKYGFDTEEKLAGISEADLLDIYKKEFWRFDSLSDDIIAAKIFDHAVNFGLGTMVRMAQEALNLCGVHVMVDGKVGSQTLAAIEIMGHKLMPVLCETLWAHYKKIVEHSIKENVNLTDSQKDCNIESLYLQDWVAIGRFVKVLGLIKADQLQFAHGWHNRSFRIPK